MLHLQASRDFFELPFVKSPAALGPAMDPDGRGAPETLALGPAMDPDGVL